ncbi:hypothetical protein BAUCODRAFT_330337 [Baudoinia panamericana UAMH 10762]|uniref:Uncharacterized protein n=1 Tax=Baudoinia panamericana (strain UAMH 10762) TaxID=717646 RepID=M2M4J4_BAUPA|nr:uncharacterized protein BAUCODRAFT_330337 [Baudoinia panamericana UAMH 10762]EMC91501.1 hypothetical protein BAUCODRAFT_330337 [Baudoinia panamericana UAMH 10762]
MSKTTSCPSKRPPQRSMRRTRIANRRTRLEQTASSRQEVRCAAKAKIHQRFTNTYTIGAAASLKYARAQDLPSFPSTGHVGDGAGLKAANLAKDYKMQELWQPELSSAGSRAALLAHKEGPKLDLWQPSASKAGNSAAVLAMRGAQGLSPQLDRGYTPEGKSNSLKAANLSINRSGTLPPSAPPSYPDAENAGHNALNAATSVHRRDNSNATTNSKLMPDGWDSEANQAARVTHLHMKPEMFTEHPPVDVGNDEAKHQAALRASAVSMAKQMYEHQNRTAFGSDLTPKELAAATPSGQQRDMKQEALRYINLQDAAHKLAQERLAKIDKNFEQAQYREYYGYPDQTAAPRKSISSRLSMSGGRRPRNRDSAEADPDDSDDEANARRIRSQMSQLNSGLQSVDEKKRTDDRARLLAAAEAKVHAQMHSMDEKVFADTGKVSPAMMEEWEAKARKRAEEERAERAAHPGQVNIGGGKFMAQSEIEAIAAARLKPTLDEINDTAEKRRARDQEIREQKEEEERLKREEKERKAQEKMEARRAKCEYSPALCFPRCGWDVSVN